MKYYDVLLGQELRYAEPLFLIKMNDEDDAQLKSNLGVTAIKGGGSLYTLFNDADFRYRFLVAVNARFGAQGQLILHEIMKQKTVDYSTLRPFAVTSLEIKPDWGDLPTAKCDMLLERFQVAKSPQEVTQSLTAPCYLVRESDASQDTNHFLHSWSVFLFELLGVDLTYMAKSEVVLAMRSAGYILQDEVQPSVSLRKYYAFEWHGYFTKAAVG